MQRILIVLIVVVCAAFTMIGAEFTRKREENSNKRKPCVGYTVIEAGIGIDCKGDTVQLRRARGYYELTPGSLN